VTPLEAPAPAYTTLYSFTSAPDGNSPTAALVLYNGLLYGTTYGGGATPSPGPCLRGCGAVYSLDPSHPARDTVIYQFKGAPDGAIPEGAVDGAPHGKTLYGTTAFGGIMNSSTCPQGCGIIFQIDASNHESVLHTFQGSPNDGANPVAGLSTLKGSTFYGTTKYGGKYGLGTVFALATNPSNYSLIYSFKGEPHDGAYPVAAVVEIGNALYGVTSRGGSSNRGTVFKVTLGTPPTEAPIHSFTAAEGDYPSGLDAATSSILYGTTSADGPYQRGTVYSITTAGVLHLIYSFKHDPDAGRPYVRPRFFGAGVLYGTTWGGGQHGIGAIYEVNTSGTKECVLHSFLGTPDGMRPLAPLRQWNGVFYGTTVQGGKNGLGTVFRILPHACPTREKMHATLPR
jgi:uncharacterized repeat protein (TIGR03803 family)